jgi:hypothetical protein
VQQSRCRDCHGSRYIMSQALSCQFQLHGCHPRFPRSATHWLPGVGSAQARRHTKLGSFLSTSWTLSYVWLKQCLLDRCKICQSCCRLRRRLAVSKPEHSETPPDVIIRYFCELFLDTLSEPSPVRPVFHSNSTCAAVALGHADSSSAKAFPNIDSREHHGSYQHHSTVT